MPPRIADAAIAFLGRRRATWTNTVRSPASACARSAASDEAVVGSDVDQSTTVVIPASVAPSKPISVAA